MTRLTAAAAWLALLPVADAARADTPPAGRWKFRAEEPGQPPITFLFAFSEADGKWVGDYIGSTAKLAREPQFSSLQVSGDAVRFTLTFAGREFLSFDGLLAKDGKKITGSVSQFGGPLKLTVLHPSKLKKLDDPIELAREDLAQLEVGEELFDAGFTVLGAAAAKKLPAEEVRGIADKLAKASGPYGPRWERTVALKLANTLAGQEGFAEVALTQARRAERMLADDSPAAAQMEVYDTLTRVLTKAGKVDEAKKYAAMVGKLEARDYAEFAKTGLGFTPEPYKGRKGKGDRAVLVEVFTGTECAPCAAVDLAAHGLVRAFQPTEVIVLEYHLPVSGPDPLMCQDGMERFESYGLKAAPSVRVNGKPGPQVPGPASAAAEKYKELRELVEKQLEATAPVKLAVAVTPGEKGAYTAKATVSNLESPGEKTVLRFVLAEEKVRFAGQSGVAYHAHVVRALPGGVKGFPLTKKAQEQAVTIDPAEVRAKVNKFLDDFAKSEGEFPKPDRPLALANLKLVALVQNDATGEVLQAVQVDLK
jgi:hypothetical protein